VSDEPTLAKLGYLRKQGRDADGNISELRLA
jgi:hypothetical protein